MSQQLQSLRQQIALVPRETLIITGASLALGAFALNAVWRFFDTKPSTVQGDGDNTMSKTVVVLGGGMSGIATAHKLLKYPI